LAASLGHALIGSHGRHLSLKELAEAVGVDPGTLRHYFEDRRGVVRAAMESLLPSGEAKKARAAELSKLPAREGLGTLIRRIVAAWPHLLGGMHATGFVEGMSDPDLGQAYIATIFEPTLDAVEKLLVAYDARGELRIPDARIAALGLMSPVLLGLFHQHQLMGRKCRPLDLNAFVEGHLDGFFSGYGPKAEVK
jgi:AcrR family transcriptional regulator